VRRPLVASAFAALLLAPAASGGVGLGVLGNPARFEQVTGQRTQTHHLIAGWGYRGLSRLLATMGERPMLGINANTSRPLAEMNGHWNGYSAFDRNGSSRGPDHSTRAFRKAFARIWLAVHGGPTVNAQLRRLGLPPFRAELVANRNGIVVWNPQGYGSPDIPGNSAAAYYPGDRYVDAVGDDLYYLRGKAEWAAADALYRAHPRKPFMFPEWGLWGIDAPQFVEQMARFVRTHPRTTLIAYYSGRPGSVFDLASKPRARAAYRRLIVPLARR